MKVGLTTALKIVAERRKDYPLHADSLDAVAREIICEAIPPGLHTPSSDDTTRSRMSTGSPGLLVPPHGTTRACFERLYRDLIGDSQQGMTR